jgi:hypothetical protein
MAPEMIRHELYTSKADVFSWGVLLAEVLSQRPPYEGLYMTPVQVCHCSSFSGTPQYIVRLHLQQRKGSAGPPVLLQHMRTQTSQEFAFASSQGRTSGHAYLHAEEQQASDVLPLPAASVGLLV